MLVDLHGTVRLKATCDLWYRLDGQEVHLYEGFYLRAGQEREFPAVKRLVFISESDGVVTVESD